ncbi:alpha/beta hydrolase fold [Musa troglodytarum]|uniref:Alpha/beta hydrolase fold n=1 Tax=Musa troglodytarum TaxID=320322 RepID=A0A9E7KAN1_9LILI|nr:alpha/beta hydrolase fold [Musa troglodytarum]
MSTRNRGSRPVVRGPRRADPTPRPASAPPPLGPCPQKEPREGVAAQNTTEPLEPPTSNAQSFPDFGFILSHNPQQSVPGSPCTSIYMAGALDLAVSRGWGRGWTVAGEGKGSGVRAVALLDPSARRRVPVPLQDYTCHVGRFSPRNPKIKYSSSHRRLHARMALVDDKIVRSPNVAKPNLVLAYDLVQGSLVSWNSFMDKSIPDPPTAVLLHGILGSRKNWGSFAKRLVQEFPMWQFLLVDLRCHGESALIKKNGPHTVASAALDVLKLVAQLRVTPRVLVGHSFGGKVALSMVWVLDATPGKVRAGGDGEDHPGELIAFLSMMPRQVSSKQNVVDALIQEGFSTDIARWVATNLRPVSQPGSTSSGFSWNFDLKGIADMYKSYEETNLWETVENVPRGVHVNFLKAERSLHRWALEDLRRIRAAEELAADEGAGVQLHVLEDAGHWVHADNPDGLFRILSSSFLGLRTQ